MTTEERILATAETHIRKSGYHGFSFRDIARDTGLTNAGVHHHFPTKSDLVARLAQTYTERFLNALDASPIEKRVVRLRDLFSESLARDGQMCLCGLLAAESSGLPEPVARAARSFFEQVAERLKHTFAASDDPSSKAWAILAQLEGAALLSKVREDPGFFDLATRELETA